MEDTKLILEGLAEIKTEMRELRTEVNEVKVEIRELRTEVEEVRIEVREVRPEGVDGEGEGRGGGRGRGRQGADATCGEWGRGEFQEDQRGKQSFLGFFCCCC